MGDQLRLLQHLKKNNTVNTEQKRCKTVYKETTNFFIKSFLNEFY